jgi:DNA-binding transcriptional MerR regulator
VAATRSNSGESRARGVAVQHAGEQGLLFGDEQLAAHPDDVGYRGPTACAAAGITYRQLDYWARTGLVEPSVRPAQGSGSQRLYSFRDILVLKVVKRLLDTGISLQQIRAAVLHLRDRGAGDLARLTLMSDGVSVYECTSTDEVVDLLAGGPPSGHATTATTRPAATPRGTSWHCGGPGAPPADRRRGAVIPDNTRCTGC